MKVITGWLSGLLAIVLATGIIRYPELPAYGAEKPIRIGATVSLEGSYSKLSFMVKNGYELWAKEVNERGGILGRKVELLFYDDKSREDLVGPLYEKLIAEDKVDMVFSPYSSTLTVQASAVTEKYGYVMLAAAASAEEIWTRGFKSMFGVYSTADRYFVGFLDLAAREKLKRVAVIYSNTAFNIAAADGVKKWAGLFGLTLVLSKKYDAYETELAAIVDSLRSKDIEGLIFCAYPPDSYFFLKLLQDMKFRPPGLAIAIAPALPDFFTKVGPFAEGIFGPSQWEADKRLPFPGTLEFIEKFVAVTGEKPDYHACSAYSAGQIIEKAVLLAGTIDQKKIRNYIATLDTVTILGRFKVDSEGRQVGHNPMLIQWQKGVKEIVYPTKMQTAPGYFAKNNGLKQ